MVKNKVVKLEFDGEEDSVECVVTYDTLIPADTFMDMVLWVIRTDKNVDVLETLTNEQAEAIETQITNESTPTYGITNDDSE